MKDSNKQSTRLSININKVALIRNARGENFPDLIKFAIDCEHFGAQGITVHPRPDERHIRYADIAPLKEVVSTELNIEGNPTDQFTQLVLNHVPHQVTLVPDAPDALTSDSGWDTISHFDFLKARVEAFHEKGIRVSVFMDPIKDRIEAAAQLGADCIELYTGKYAKAYESENATAVLKKHSQAAQWAKNCGLKVNAGHDLNLHNLPTYAKHIHPLDEVSIGHALVVDCLYYGLENVIPMYLQALKVDG